MNVPGPRWFVPLAIGILVGAVVEWVVAGESSSGGWLIWATPVATVGAAFVSGVVGGYIPSAQAERAEHNLLTRNHVQSLSTKVYRWLPQLSFRSDRHELPRPAVYRGGIVAGDLNLNSPTVDDLDTWNLAESHLLQDPIVGPQWGRLVVRRAERDQLREGWSKLFWGRLEARLTEEFGGDWVRGINGVVPEPENWYEGSVIWNRTQSRGPLGEFSDVPSSVAYFNLDHPDEKRYTVMSRGALLISSRNRADRAEKLLQLLNDIQADPEIETARKKVVEMDSGLERDTVALRGPLREFYERTSETGKLTGRCNGCP